MDDEPVYVQVMGWAIVICIIIVALYSMGHNDGYKSGQLDYSLGKISYKYTINVSTNIVTSTNLLYEQISGGK